MAKDSPTEGTAPATWVPAGLKVRGVVSVDGAKTPDNAAEVTPEKPPRTASQKPVVPPSDPRPIAYVVDPALEPPLERAQDANFRSSIAQKPRGPGFEPMPVLTILSIVCLGILVMLGSWQWDKFVAKSKAPSAVTAIEPSSVAAALETSNPEYKRVVVDGLMDARTIKVMAVQDGTRGYRLFSPVVLEVGGVFVDRGFLREEEVGKIPDPSGQVRIDGVLRLGAKSNAYTPDNEPARDVWYWPDLKAMADTLLMQGTGQSYYVATLEVDPLGTGQTTTNPYADSKGASKVPPERHLGYALTWWGFGLALLGVYTGLHVRTGRLRFGSEKVARTVS